MYVLVDCGNICNVISTGWSSSILRTRHRLEVDRGTEFDHDLLGLQLLAVLGTNLEVILLYNPQRAGT